MLAHAPVTKHRVGARHRERAPAGAALAAQATAPVTPSVVGSLPPSGADGIASGVGGAAPGATAVALLALAAVALIGALMPGLLAIDVLIWRSAILDLRLERPG